MNLEKQLKLITQAKCVEIQEIFQSVLSLKHCLIPSEAVLCFYLEMLAEGELAGALIP